MPSASPDRVLLLSMHTSPVAQPGSGDAGGMNVYVRHLAHALARAGWHVDLATLDREPSRTAGVRAADLEPGVRLLTVCLPGAWDAPKESLPRFAQPFGEALTRFYAQAAAGPGVVHAHYWLSGMAGLALARALGTPLVLTLHTSAAAKNLRAGVDETHEPAEREDAERMLVARACRTVANTPAEKEQLEQLCAADPARVTVIPPGVDPTVFHPPGHDGAPGAPGVPGRSGTLGPRAVEPGGSPPAPAPVDNPATADPREPFTVLCAGRMQPLKGQQVLVRALGELRTAHPGDRVRLVLAGTGSAEFLNHLRDLVRQAAVADRVEFLGSLPRPELARLMGEADAVAVPSSSETFGLVALEAQACGTPVLATDVDGLRWAVRDGETGRLVPGRDPAVWAEALHRAAAEPARWNAMSPAALLRARELTWDDVAAQHAVAYRTCAGAPRTP